MITENNDLVGLKFNKLTVIKRLENKVYESGETRSQYLCECDCEEKNKVIVLGKNLKNGNTKSCGCLKKKAIAITIKANKKYNTYDLSGEYGIGYTSNGKEFYFDLEDYDKIKDYYWYIDNHGYVRTDIRIDNKKVTLWMHRLVMCLNDIELCVDHIHGNQTKNDNRKSNLRIATRSQNQMNACLSTNNTSGITGVYWYKPSKKWLAIIMVNRQRIHLGYFEKFEDAVKARKEAEEKYFGEFSYDNSQSY